MAVCAEVDGAPVGMAVSSFTSVSLQPALVSICVRLTSRTWPRLRAASQIGLSVLARSHTEVCRALSAEQGDRFAKIDRRTTPSGAILVAGAPLWMECKLENELSTGDHLIAVLEVERLRADHATDPLIFHRSDFRELAE